MRYLHQLFESQERTVCGWIRHQRLLMCDEALRNVADRRSITEIAYQWGFGDQAQFSRSYRAHFGRTPSDTRAAAFSAGPPGAEAPLRRGAPRPGHSAATDTPPPARAATTAGRGRGDGLA